MATRLRHAWSRFTHWWTVRKMAVAMLVVAAVTGIVGYLNQHTGGFSFGELINEFYANFSTELASIAITVLIINALYERREIHRLKAQLVREMWSTDHGIAMRAAREIEEHGWHKDGSLRNAMLIAASLSTVNFSGADLRGAVLFEADLREAVLDEADLSKAILAGAVLTGAGLSKANLTEAILVGIQLQAADLTGANLSKARLVGADLSQSHLDDADLSEADLREADLTEVNLKGAKLTGAKVEDGQLSKARSLKGATVPDGTTHD